MVRRGYKPVKDPGSPQRGPKEPKLDILDTRRGKPCGAKAEWAGAIVTCAITGPHYTCSGVAVSRWSGLQRSVSWPNGIYERAHVL